MCEGVAPIDHTQTTVAVVAATTGTTTAMDMDPATLTIPTSTPTTPGRGEEVVDSFTSEMLK